MAADHLSLRAWNARRISAAVLACALAVSWSSVATAKDKKKRTVAAATTELVVPATPALPPPPKVYTLPAKQVFGKIVDGPTKGLPPRAIGGYAKGCLSGGVAMPIDGPAWQAMRLSRNRNWGHPVLVNLLKRFATEMKEQDGWPGLNVGDMSQPRGGPMWTGHKSHQIGLDADIWFLPMPDRTLTFKEREVFEPLKVAEEKGTEVIAANWNPGFVGLVRRVAKYPETERILLHPAIKRALCEATPEAERDWLRKVRPTLGHNYHFHVRLSCPGDLPGCVPQKPTLPDHGCGKELEDWLKRISYKPKPKPKPPVPPVPPKPKPPGPPKPKPKPKVQTILDLPAGCAEVAISGTDEVLYVNTKDGPLPAAKVAAAAAAAAAQTEAPQGDTDNEGPADP